MESTQRILDRGKTCAIGQPRLTRHELQEIQRRNALARSRRAELAVPKPVAPPSPKTGLRAVLGEFWDEYGAIVVAVLVKSAWILGMFFEMWREGIFK